MCKETIASLTACFGLVEDPRTGPALIYALMEITVIAICAVICGAERWVDVEAFGKAGESWLKRFLKLGRGIPSHDTFGRVFARLDPEQIESYFLEWVQAVSEVTRGQVIAVDGKTIRRSHDRKLSKKAIHMVSAWATANHLVLGCTVSRSVTTLYVRLVALKSMILTCTTELPRNRSPSDRLMVGGNGVEGGESYPMGGSEPCVCSGGIPSEFAFQFWSNLCQQFRESIPYFRLIPPNRTHSATETSQGHPRWEPNPYEHIIPRGYSYPKHKETATWHRTFWAPRSSVRWPSWFAMWGRQQERGPSS